jgi:hypothetical protein
MTSPDLIPAFIALNLHAEPAAGDRSSLLELLHHELHGIGRNGESDADEASRGREDRGIDPDHLALHVEGRTAGITFIDRRIDLDEIVERSRADVAPAGRNDAGSHRAAESEGIADREHPITDPRLGARELDVGEIIAAVDLDQRHVGLRIGADHLGRIGLAVVGRDLEVAAVFDHVIVGHGVTVGRDEKARAQRGSESVLLRVLIRISEELVERRAGRKRKLLLG